MIERELRRVDTELQRIIDLSHEMTGMTRDSLGTETLRVIGERINASANIIKDIVLAGMPTLIYAYDVTLVRWDGVGNVYRKVVVNAEDHHAAADIAIKGQSEDGWKLWLVNRKDS